MVNMNCLSQARPIKNRIPISRAFSTVRLRTVPGFNGSATGPTVILVHQSLNGYYGRFLQARHKRTFSTVGRRTVPIDRQFRAGPNRLSVANCFMFDAIESFNFIAIVFFLYFVIFVEKSQQII